MQKASKKLRFASFLEEKKNKISVSKEVVIRLYKKLYEQNAVAEVLPLKQGLKPTIAIG